MPRFFLEHIDTENPSITGEDARHIGRSLRMRPGEKLTVCACGVDYECDIKSITEDTVYLNIQNSRLCSAEPSIKLTLFQAVPKQDKLEHIIQKAVELGASEIVPVLTRRCVSRPDKKDFEKKRTRLNKIALEAAKQSGRGIIPDVTSIVSFSEAVEQMKAFDCPVMLYEEGGIRFSELKTENKKTVALFVGSEGGFDEEEAEAARAAGIQTVWLGERILRCETAPLTAISILMYITKNL
ncbi:RsmE family RNA methyltransferase [Porcipelethomonas sp.]|uniref:RsmE family RNA methyltransferase n=1 Tax=Porcipelethomonas sp. TaxID=2981675 RepID=UPI003EF91465